MSANRLATAFLTPLFILALPTAALSESALPPSMASALVRAPFHFEPNRGQADASVRFLSRGDGYTLFLDQAGATLRLRVPEPAAPDVPSLERGRPEVRKAPSYASLRLRFPGASPVKPVAEERLTGHSNYLAPVRAEVVGRKLIARKPASTDLAGIPHYRRVRIPDLYPGIDAVFYGAGRELEYDFIVCPGADPGRIRVRFDGASSVRLDEAGRLVLSTPAGDVVQHAPVAYQQSGGERETVSAKFVLQDGEARFDLGRYDRTRPLVIDPVLAYGTFFGGSGADEARALVIDKDGNIIVGGQTDSPDLPRQNPPYGDYAGSYDGFISKFSPDGQTLLYSTYVGYQPEATWDSVNALAADANGNVLVAGLFAGEVLFAKLAPNGSEVFGVVFGGTSADEAKGVALGPDGTVYLTGKTESWDYDGTPDVWEGFPSTPGAIQENRLGTGDAFICRINVQDPANLFFVYSTYLGGTANLLGDDGLSIAVDTVGNAYVAGETPSADFPVTATAAQPDYGGHLSDGFLAKINPDGTAVLYATFFGGGFNEQANAVALDAAGNAYVTGWSNSDDFPTTDGAFMKDYHYSDCDPHPTGFLPCADAWVARIDTTKSGAASRVYATYFGGSFSDYGYGLTVEPDGTAYVVGQTGSIYFPVKDNFPKGEGERDGFLAILNPAGDDIALSTRFGGESDDRALAVALDAQKAVWIAGYSGSADLPRANAMDSTLGGTRDAFLAKIVRGGTPVAGDVDGSGTFDVQDVRLALRLACGLGASTADQVTRGDVSGADGRMDLPDAEQLIRRLNGL